MDAAQAVRRLESKRRQFQVMQILYLVVLVVALVLFFVNREAMAGLALAAIVFYMAVMRPYYKRLNREIAGANLQVCLGGDLQELAHRYKPGVDQALVTRCALFPQEEKGFVSREYITGRAGNLQVEGSDISTHYFVEQNGKRKAVWLSGAWIQIELSRDSGADLRIVSRELLPERIRENQFLRKQELSTLTLPEIGGAFEAYSAAGEPTLPAMFLRHLRELQESTNGDVALYLKGDELAVFVARRFLTFNVQIRQAITREMLERHPFPELKGILALARDFER